jgi:hypothetical protein
MRARVNSAELLAALRTSDAAPQPVPPGRARARGLTRAPDGPAGAGSASTSDLPRPSDYVVAAVQSAGRLVGVPIAYLAPDPALLPAESLQFFVVDTAWVRALQRGLLSAGSPLPLADDDLDALLDQIAPRPAAATGLLLRSLLVADYPTLTVRAWTGDLGPEDDPDDPQFGAMPVTLTRAERLTPSTLVVLFDRVPDLVVIDEPHGTLRLGVTNDPGGPPLVRLRSGDADLFEVAGAPVDVAVSFRGDPDDGIISVTALANDLQAAIQTAQLAGVPDPRTSPSGFALQLLAAPVRQRYQRGVVR